MPSKPLNPLSKLAVLAASKAVREYLGRLLVLLMENSEKPWILMETEVEALRYTWIASVEKTLNDQVAKILSDLKSQSVDMAKKAAEIIGENPQKLTLQGMFNVQFDDKVWQAVKDYRATATGNLSARLWDLSGDAARKTQEIVMRATREGLTFDQVKKELAELLTAEGKDNLDYNVRRLWADQLKRNRIIAMKATWEHLGYIHKVKLTRSPTADPECGPCATHIGPNPGDFVIVNLEDLDPPPWHPWCQCEAEPVPPTAADFMAYWTSRP